MLTQVEVQSLFHYDNGKLIRKKHVRGSKGAGSVVGTKNHHGYIQTMIRGKTFMVHRVIWLWHYGYIPENDIDHINRNKSDNRIENLREVSPTCNARNRSQMTNTISGIRGVSWSKKEMKWVPEIMIGGKHVYLGSFNCKLEAACHRLMAEQVEGWAGCDSISPAYMYVKKHLGLVKP